MLIRTKRKIGVGQKARVQDTKLNYGVAGRTQNFQEISAEGG